LYEVVKEKDCEIDELHEEKRLDIARLEAQSAEWRQVADHLSVKNSELEARLARVEALLETSPLLKGIKP
jgi:hypothetical protein